jgi:hypothetical protein
MLMIDPSKQTAMPNVPCPTAIKDQTPFIRFVVDLFCCTANPHQIHNFRQVHNKSIHNISTCHDVVDLLCTRQQIHNKSNQWSLAFDLFTTYRKAVQQLSRKAVQQIHSKSTTLRQVVQLVVQQSTANPQQIE